MEKIRVAVTYRVCQGWRAPIFARLARTPGIQLMVFHGQDVPGTKIMNTKNFDGIPHCELQTFKLRLSSSGRASTWILYPSIVTKLRKFRPDVLLCEGGSNIFNNLLIYAWAKLARVPTIWWTLGYIPGRKKRGLSRMFTWLSDRMMKRSSVLLGYSSRAKRYFAMTGCRQPQFVAVNCVDTDVALKNIERARAAPLPVRQRFGLEDKKVIIFVGALTEGKSIDNLLHAYAEVRRKRNDVALLIVGDGAARAALEDCAQRTKAPDVHFAGQIVEEVSHYFLAADVFVLPGLGGLAISDAMCHGLPVICTVADGCEEDLVVRGRNGMVVPPDDVGALATSIDELLRDPERLAAMGRESLRIIETQYNVHTYFCGIVDAIQCANEMRRQ